MKYLKYISIVNACALLLALPVVTACSDNDVAEEIKTTPSTEDENTEEQQEEQTTTWDGTFDQGATAFKLTDRALVCSYNNTFCTTTNKSMESVEGKGVLVSWRWLSTDGDMGFDVYRDGTKLNSEPITNSTNYKDYDVTEGTKYTYTLKNADTDATLGTYSITPGKEAFYKVIPMHWDTQYQYEINDCAVGDLDGDGEYEIVVKRYVVGQATDNSSSGTVKEGSCILDAYKMDGTFMWRVDLGININQGAHYTPFIVYDFNGNGRAELAVRTSEMTTFGDGTTIGDVNGDGITDYRITSGSSVGMILSGPEFLSVIDGKTGKEIARTDYIPRGDESTWEEYWGDSYGNRIDRFLMAAAHLDSQDGRADIIISRGYYVNWQMWAVHLNDDGNLRVRWKFNTADSGNSTFIGQGNHNLAVGDVDGDGKDEIVFGACTIDHDGTGLSSTGLGHGDALHLGEFVDGEGLRVVACHEEESVHGGVGCEYRNPVTSSWSFYIPGSDDVGRCMVADVYPDSPGSEYWSSADGNIHSCITGESLGISAPTGIGGGVSCNFGIYWTGSLNRQLLDGHSNSSYVGDNVVVLDYDNGRVFQGGDYFDVKCINSTKCNPCYSGDIWGDWREEMILPTKDDNYLYVFTTDFETQYRIHPLMDDHVYRMAAAIQNVGYNQPPHTGYYIGSDKTDYSDN